MSARLEGRGGRPVRNRGITALIALLLAGAAFVIVRFLLTFTFPIYVASPDVAGIVASRSSNDFDAPEVRLVLVTGDEVVLHRDDRALLGGAGEGDLIVFGSTPERWYVTGFLGATSNDPGCYSISADRAYSESGGVVIVWDDWPGEGVRLPRAPGYDDSGLVYEQFGHLAYTQFELGSGISFCLDAEGRVTRKTF